MRVLNVIDGTGWCGTKEQTYLITLLLKERGVESELALAENHQEMINRLKDKVKLHFYGIHKGGISRFNPKNLIRFRQIMSEGKFDVVIAHSSHALDLVRLVYPFLKSKPKIIALRRSGFIPSLLSRRFKYSIADKIVVVSKHVAEILKERAFFPERIEVIESGIDLSRFYPKPEIKVKVRKALGVDENALVFMNVANWQPWRKGQEVILKALSILRERVSLSFRMFFVGLGTDSREAMETFKKFGLEDYCTGLGFREDVHELLQAADIFLFGSFSEGIAGAVLQAMATGRIVVSTNAGGIPEYLKDGYNGFLASAGNPEEMATKIEKALDLSEERRKAMVEKAILTAKEYSIERTVDKYVDLLRRLLEE